MLSPADILRIILGRHRTVSGRLVSRAAAAFVVMSTVALSQLTIVSLTTKHQEDSPPTLDQRVALLGQQLTDASSAISEIEQEVEARQRLVSKLESDQRTFEALAQMDQAEVEAVSQALRQQIDESKSFWDSPWGRFLPGFVSGLTFFTLGTLVVGPWLQRRRNRSQQELLSD